MMIIMKNSIKKITAAIAASALCAIPMMNAMSASAFIYVSGSEIAGDVNNDGSINLSDSEALDRFLKYPSSNYVKIGNKSFTIKVNIYTADVNGDGCLTDFDVNLIGKYARKEFGSGYTNYSFRNFYKYVGDVNGDGKVDNTDATLIDQNKVSSSRKIYADVNGDNKVNSADATAIRNYKDHKVWATTATAPKFVSGANIGGDVNNDGKVNQKDYTDLNSFFNAPKTANVKINIYTADMDHNNTVDATDLSLLAKKVNK